MGGHHESKRVEVFDVAAQALGFPVDDADGERPVVVGAAAGARPHGLLVDGVGVCADDPVERVDDVAVRGLSEPRLPGSQGAGGHQAAAVVGAHLAASRQCGAADAVDVDAGDGGDVLSGGFVADGEVGEPFDLVFDADGGQDQELAESCDGVVRGDEADAFGSLGRPDTFRGEQVGG